LQKTDKAGIVYSKNLPLISTAVCGAVIFLSITPLFGEASPGFNKKKPNKNHWNPQQQQPKQQRLFKEIMRITTLILFIYTIFVVSHMCNAQLYPGWPQPEQLLSSVVYGCDNSTIPQQQLCGTINTHPRALNHVPMNGTVYNTTELILQSVAMSFINTVQVKNLAQVQEGKATPSFKVMSGDCAGAIVNVLCAQFFMNCSDTLNYQLPCKYRCDQLKNDCSGQPLTAYGVAFVNSLDCNDPTKFAPSEPCTSDAVSAIKMQWFPLFATVLLLIFLILF
jgi:hypothetical protein